jgi:FkbM family methyltransferase
MAGAMHRALARLGVAVVRQSTLTELERSREAAEDIRFLGAMQRPAAAPLLEFLSRSHSQNRQDLFVLAELGFPRQGYFVEFGATDGVVGSNTCLPEREFGWRGIVAEPARCWHERLRANRSCIVETACLWRESGAQLSFTEVDAYPALSTISEFRGSDSFYRERSHGSTYQVTSISLQDLLRRHDAPREIDYLSIDTEGSEFDILNSLDLTAYRPRVITCEHNYTPARQQIHELLARHGYLRKFEEFSKYDDWYVLGV